jgi:DNA polymerase III subunit delta
MPQASIASVLKQIDAGRPDPIYLIYGEDETEKSALAAAFTGLVDEAFRDFNIEKFHGSDMATAEKLIDGVGTLVAAARTMPMMSPRRLIMVLQAEWLIAPKRESEGVARALAQLEQLLDRPEPHTTLVFVAATVDKRSRLYKILAKQATFVECGVLGNVADAERWVRNRVAAAGQTIDPAAAGMLARAAGTDVKRLRGEMDRLLLYAQGQERISVDDVRAISGPQTLQDEWAITNAIEAGQTAEALRQLGLMFDAGGVPEKILGQIGWLVRSRFSGVAAGEQRRAVDAVFRTDLDLKRSAGDARVLLERLVVEVCAVKRSRSGGRRW